MKKAEVIHYINNSEGEVLLRNTNTHFASKGSNRNIWWMNIPVSKLKIKDLNIVFVGDLEVHWFYIPRGTFAEPEKNFRVWEAKNAIDLLVSSDPRDRYMIDIASGATGVDFKQYLKKSFPLPALVKKSTSNLLVNGPILYGHNPQTRHRKIKAGETNISYDTLFGEYLKGASTITLQDPYIRHPREFDNFIEFCQLLKEIKQPDTTIQLDIITWNDNEFQKVSEKNFEEVAEGLK